MRQAAGVLPLDLRQRQVAAGCLVVAAVAQLLGQVLLRVPTAQVSPLSEDSGPSDLWGAGHIALMLAAVCWVVGAVVIARLIGSGQSMLLGVGFGVTLAVVGQILTIVILAVDLAIISVTVDVIRFLDDWDFLAVAGLVVLLLQLRRRAPETDAGANLALVALAVPAVDGLVMIAAVAVVIGFTALALRLVTGRRSGAIVWLTWATCVVYAVAGAVSWQRAALAAVVLLWTIRQQSAHRHR